MLVESTFIVLVFLAWRKVRGRKGMTQERRDIYLAALEHLPDPAALRELADGFEKDGLPIEASMLRKRADLRAMPREKWENFRALCERAIQKPDVNPQALDEMASAFDAMTATGTAAKLRKRAAERRMEILAKADLEERKRQETAYQVEQEERAKVESEARAKESEIEENSYKVHEEESDAHDEDSGAHVMPTESPQSVAKEANP